MANTLKRFNLWIALILLVINIILFSFLIEELIDASEPNYGGGLSFLTPVLGLISLVYIKKSAGENHRLMVRILQGLNWLFILFPIAVIVYIILLFI